MAKEVSMAGLNARQRADAEARRKEGKTRALYIVIGVVVVLLIALIIIVNSSLFKNGFKALKVTDSENNVTGYTVADVNYAYQSAYMNFYSSYSSFISYILDTSTPLSEQECTWDENAATWDDYFKNEAEDNLVQETAYYDAALAAGYTVTEDDQAEIDSAISNYEMYASLYGYTLNGYLAMYFGDGNTEKTVRAAMAREAIIQDYLADRYDRFTYTEDELNAYCEEHIDDMTTVYYSYAVLSADTEAEEPLAEAREQADAIMADADAETFADVVTEQTGSAPTSSTYTKTSFLSAYGENVTSEEVVPGTIFSQETDDSITVVCITDVQDENYNTVSVRHILIEAVDEDGDGEYSEEELKAAEDKINEIRAEYEAGPMTEESFAELANEYSEDTGSNTNGGLYEDIYKGEMVDEFDQFCFEEHQPGDIAVVYGESSSYAGYHLVYFVSADGPLYSHVQAEDNLRSEDYSQMCEEMVQGYTATRTFMWRYVMK